MRKKLVDYLEVNDLICNKQYGFRSGRSCLTQLLHHFDDVLEALANNSDFDSIYLDYAKAFDKVDHKLLLRKLQLYGIHPKIVKWIESFLLDRKQAVVVDGKLSILALILSGVPQGTVLGPILFLIFINDIDQCIVHSIIRCFADDAIRCENDVSLLQSDLYNVMRWSERNNMALHKDKFEYMCHKFNKNRALPELPFSLLSVSFTSTQCRQKLLLSQCISSVILAFLSPVICHGHPTFDPLQKRPDRKHRGFSVCSILGRRPYTNQWCEVWSNTAVLYGILLKSVIFKNWKVCRKHSFLESPECETCTTGIAWSTCPLCLFNADVRVSSFSICGKFCMDKQAMT